VWPSDIAQKRDIAAQSMNSVPVLVENSISSTRMERPIQNVSSCKKRLGPPLIRLFEEKSKLSMPRTINMGIDAHLSEKNENN
jgi:hypothetical protein